MTKTFIAANTMDYMVNKNAIPRQHPQEDGYLIDKFFIHIPTYPSPERFLAKCLRAFSFPDVWESLRRQQGLAWASPKVLPSHEQHAPVSNTVRE